MAGRHGDRRLGRKVNGGPFADIKLYAGDVKEVVIGLRHAYELVVDFQEYAGRPDSGDLFSVADLANRN